MVTLPDGTQYMPITTVKSAAQAAALGLPSSAVGSVIPVYVPPGVNPGALISNFASIASDDLLGFGTSEPVLAATFAPHGPYDYKSTTGVQYDQFGNFLYGATGAVWGYTSTELQAAAGGVHSIYTGPSNGPYNNLPVNYNDIQSGYNAINNGGRVSTVPVPGGG